MRPSLRPVLDWLRAGYPDGIPRSDYLPLLEVLQRRLTETEVREVVAHLLAQSAEGPVEPADIERAITAMTMEAPRDDDVQRVAARLAAVAGPHSAAQVAADNHDDEPGVDLSSSGAAPEEGVAG